jgi:hypothetical protein
MLALFMLKSLPAVARSTASSMCSPSPELVASRFWN